ncbi:MAG: LysE family transporter [Chitinophagaceae bacterium]|nr:LysE family transporter [Chitinophagaceae bacterium]
MGLILALSVGPVIFTIIKQSINNGFKGGLSFVAGVWLSDIVLVLLSNFFSGMVSYLLEYKNTIAIVGSLFLLIMGVYYIFFKKVQLAEDNDLLKKFSTSDFTKIALSGFLINTLNPGVIIFWLINATTFAATNTLSERTIIFSICLIVNIIADLIKIMMAGKIREKLTPRHIVLINKISGSILVLFGLGLLFNVFFA